MVDDGLLMSSYPGPSLPAPLITPPLARPAAEKSIPSAVYAARSTVRSSLFFMSLATFLADGVAPAPSPVLLRVVLSTVVAPGAPIRLVALYWSPAAAVVVH